MMREVLSMSLFTRLGLPAPREAFVRLYVNNTLVGLYAVVESIDKQFLERVFNQDDGNLFEYDYTHRLQLRVPGPGPRAVPGPVQPEDQRDPPEVRPL